MTLFTVASIGLVSIAAAEKRPLSYQHHNLCAGLETVCSDLAIDTQPPSSPPHFDVSFSATRGEIFSLKFTKYRLVAGLCLDPPLVELKRSQTP